MHYHRTINYRWSWQVWLITSLVMLFMFATFAGFVYAVFIEGDVAGYSLLLVFALLLAAVVMCEGYSPQRLEVDDARIVVLRRYASVVIERCNIASIRPLDRCERRMILARGGCMGIFGYFGSFYSRRLGEFAMYATSFERLYLIELYNGKKVVVGSDADNALEA